jgi:hypothetical protein
MQRDQEPGDLTLGCFAAHHPIDNVRHLMLRQGLAAFNRFNRFLNHADYF